MTEKDEGSARARAFKARRRDTQKSVEQDTEERGVGPRKRRGPRKAGSDETTKSRRPTREFFKRER